MTYTDYMDIIKPMMGERRYKHCVNVSIEAVRLAQKYGADPDKATVAGVSHDIPKAVGLEKHLKII